MRKGFTLVELSIVLVIIGILIGGILVAQSMIHTTKIQSFIRQINQFDVAVSNFKVKYNGLPGDTPAMGCPAVAGCPVCGNGLIENSGSYSDDSYFLCETENFWPNLQQSGFVTPGGSTLSATISGGFKVSGPIINSPQMVLGKNTGVWPAASEPANNNVFDNFYILADYSAIPDNNTIETGRIASIAAVDALAIDLKIDDGNPVYSASSNMTANDAHGGDNCRDGSNNYNLTSNGMCLVLIRMLSTGGGPQ